jgi:hypothetical protein
MEMTIMRGHDLYHAFVAGAKKLIEKKQHLNRINVFPVPDGDTGTNMSYLMQTIINQAKPSDNISETLESIADAAITGSRGNSGIIFSEYFNGLYEKMKGKAHAKLDDFKEAVSHAIYKAHQALVEPVEGTILTVIRKSFLSATDSEDFHSYFKTSYEEAKKALKETTEQLEVLKKNGVVDAGAEGFTAFLEGIDYYLTTGKTDIDHTETVDVIEETQHYHDMDVTERYCTEALMINMNRTPAEVKEALKPFGTSLIVSGRSEKMRLHIHTDNPEDVFLKLHDFGQVLEQKVDDMVRQQEALREDHPKVAIVADTIADISQELKDKYHIHTLPLNMMVDGINYLDRVTITTDTFYALLQKADEFSSSQPDQKTIERTLSLLEEHYDDIIVITVASKLSGTYQAIGKYAEGKDNITVFDSRLNSGAEGLLAVEAAKRAMSGDDKDTILAALENKRKNTKIYVSVNTLKYMVKNGRVSKVTGLIGKLMNLKPVISLDEEGGGIIAEKALSIKSNEKKILKLLKQRPIKEYSIVHALAPERARAFTEKVKAIAGKDPAYTTTISPIISMNSGIGAIAVSVTFDDEESEA